MCFDRENNRQITEYPLYLHEDEKGNSEIIGRRGRKVRRVEMGGGLPSGGEPYKQLVTDGEGVAKWEDRLAYEEHAQTVTWDGDVTSPRYKSYTDKKGEYRFLDDIPEKIIGLKVIGRCVQKATGETRKSETVIDSDTHVSTEGDVTYYSYIHATFDFGGESPVSANLRLTINESDKEDWPRGVTGGYSVSVLSGETYIIYIESLEFPPTVKQIDPKYLPVLTVNFELAPNEDQTISATADQTHEAVLTALMSGRKVEGVVRVMGMGQAFYLPFVTWTEVSTLDLDYNLSIAFAGFSCAGNEGTNKTFFKVTMLASGYIETDYDTGNV